MNTLNFNFIFFKNAVDFWKVWKVTLAHKSFPSAAEFTHIENIQA